MLRAFLFSSIVAAVGSAQPVYTPILFEGDPVPGWDDQTIGRHGDNPFLNYVMTPEGDVLFRAQHNESNASQHLLRFDARARETVVHVASGTPILKGDGLLFNAPWRFDTPAGGVSVIAGSFRYEDGRSAVGLVHEHNGTLQLLANNRDPVPVHGVSFEGFNSNPYFEADANAAGEAIVKARFSLDSSDHDGVYRAAPDQALSRVIDSTQPVPGHPDRAWSRSTNWQAPFELRDVPVTPAGDAYFRAWFTGDGDPEMLLLRSRRDGSLETLIDSAARTPTPGRDDHAPMLGVIQLAHGGGDGVLLTASITSSGYTGSNAGGTDVLLAHADGPMRSIWSSEHSTIPGRPDLTVQFWGGQEGAAINTDDRAVVSSFVTHDDGAFGRVLVSVGPDGLSRFIADGNDLPGQHPDASARYFDRVDINERGDVAFFASIADQYGGDALYFWSGRDGELTRVLQAGMEIQGREVLDISRSSSSSFQTAADRFLSEDGSMSAAVLLAGDGFREQQWALVHIRVPAPGSLACAGAGLMLTASRRRR